MQYIVLEVLGKARESGARWWGKVEFI